MSESAIYKHTFSVAASSIDVLGHVNNREYLRWTEEVSAKHAAALGWSLEAMLAEGAVWVARSHWIEYLRPALEGDEIDLYTWVESISAAASLRRYAVASKGKLLAVAATEWVYVDAERHRPRLIPDHVAESFPLVAPDDERLAVLGIAREPRWMPSGRTTKGV